jgi:hypothetical protein
MSRRVGAIAMIALIVGLALLLLWRVYVHRDEALQSERGMSASRSLHDELGRAGAPAGSAQGKHRRVGARRLRVDRGCLDAKAVPSVVNIAPKPA